MCDRLDILGYEFENEESTNSAIQEILKTIGEIVHKDGPNELTIEAPSPASSDAARIAEKHGGKSKQSFVFGPP